MIDIEDVRRMKLNILADSGAYMMAINETIRGQLDLPVVERRKAAMANGEVEEFDVVGKIDIRFKNRKVTCNAFVLKGDSKPLLGAIPMEEMHVLIHPLRQELIVNPEHTNYAVLKMK
ncbi:MAG: hypothetical protein LH615_15145 [Ferruginibacter sp.]|nr:hypothetical protein [Ferruginibacter sp.]